MISLHKMVNGLTVPLSEEEIAEFNAAAIAHEEKMKQFEALKYQRDRQAAYPSMADQLDIIYHQGLDAWKEQIKLVKDKYPKGNV